MLAFLGSAAFKYIAGGLAILAVVGGLWAYVTNLKASRDAALAQVASLTATNNELTAVHQNDVAAIAALKTAETVAEAARTADVAAQAAVTSAVTQTKERVIHVAVPVASRAADARDLAVLDGVRNLIAPAASPDPNANH